MFQLSESPITTEPLSVSRAGGFVSFEGKVRDHADGRSVMKLEYEAFAEMAIPQGEALVNEAINEFGLVAARVTHRIGCLLVGETAVVIQVAAAHRREAFAACEWIIDQLKWRVPIWQKEHFAEGDSGWVGAESAPPRRAESQEFLRRQTKLPFIGDQGQKRLAAGKVLLVGAGGLGSTCLPYLVGAGVGTIGIVDHDHVEESNLHRQILYNTQEIGRSKAERAAAFAKKLNPSVAVRFWPESVTRQNVDSLVEQYDWIVDGTDSLSAKFLLNDACRRHGRHLVTASVHQMEGHVMTVSPDGPCLQCIFPIVPPEASVATCEESGVLGVVPGLLGVLQANEVIKGLLGLPGTLTHELLLWNLQSGETSKIRRAHRHACPVCCGSTASDSGDDLEIGSLKDARDRFGSFDLIDIREVDEVPPCPANHQRMPSSQLQNFRAAGPTILVCATGVRSYRLAAELRSRGEIEVYSLRGGLDRLQGDAN